MENKEFNNMLHKLIEDRVAKGAESLKTKIKCALLWNDMKEHGFTEQAECFRSIVVWTCMLHPEWTDEQILEDFRNKLTTLNN
jgi:hypothetical protein